MNLKPFEPIQVSHHQHLIEECIDGGDEFVYDFKEVVDGGHGTIELWARLANWQNIYT
ncbi:MAG: hypothetical protein MUO77_11800 [Anaerolineales bacterium]|nr:hypothetical protein [Anaerolineales bacterium]